VGAGSDAGPHFFCAPALPLRTLRVRFTERDFAAAAVALALSPAITDHAAERLLPGCARMLSNLYPIVLIASAALAQAIAAPPSSAPPAPPPPFSSDGSLAAPRGNLTGLIRTEDYPLEALRAEQEGTVQVAISVDERGGVADCIVEQSSGSPSLDSQTCRLMWLRARFTPARDRRGKAVRGVYRQRITWRLEGGRPTAAWASRMMISFGPDGKLKSCRIEGEGAYKDVAEDCGKDFKAAEPAEMMGLSAANTTLVLEERFVPGATSAPAWPPAAGEKIMSRLALALDIDEHGKVSGCREIHREGMAPPQDLCAERKPSFDPPLDAAGKRKAMKAVVMFSAWVRTESVT
jgi:TonB family protein